MKTEKVIVLLVQSSRLDAIAQVQVEQGIIKSAKETEDDKNNIPKEQDRLKNLKEDLENEYIETEIKIEKEEFLEMLTPKDNFEERLNNEQNNQEFNIQETNTTIIIQELERIFSSPIFNLTPQDGDFTKTIFKLKCYAKKVSSLLGIKTGAQSRNSTKIMALLRGILQLTQEQNMRSWAITTILESSKQIRYRDPVDNLGNVIQEDWKEIVKELTSTTARVLSLKFCMEEQSMGQIGTILYRLKRIIDDTFKEISFTY